MMTKGIILTNENAKRIYNVFLNDGISAAKDFCFRLGYKLSTFYKIMKNQGKIIKKPITSRNKKWKIEQIESIVNIIGEVPEITLKEIQHKSFEFGFPKISFGTIHNYLDSELITLKKGSHENEKRNTPENKIKRKEYAEWFLNNQNLEMVFVDEFGFNLSTQRNYARSRKGDKAIIISPICAAAHASVAMAIHKDHGILYYECEFENYNRDSFNIFMTNLTYFLKDLNLLNICYILDNCPIHSHEDLSSISDNLSVKFKFLSPYSCMLNPIEEVFKDVKTNIKRMISITFRDRIKLISNMKIGRKQKERKKILIECLDLSVNEISKESVVKHINHIHSNFPGAIEMIDL